MHSKRPTSALDLQQERHKDVQSHSPSSYSFSSPSASLIASTALLSPLSADSPTHGMTSAPVQVEAAKIKPLVGEAMPFSWECLSPTDKSECLGSKCRDFEPSNEWRHAWDLAGHLKRHWENEVGRSIRAVLDSKENRCRLRKLNQPPLTRLLMLSKTPNRDHARPFVVIEHPSTAYLNFVVHLFRSQPQLEGYGIGFIGQLRLVEPLMNVGGRSNRGYNGKRRDPDRTAASPDTSASTVPHDDSFLFVGARFRDRSGRQQRDRDESPDDDSRTPPRYSRHEDQDALDTMGRHNPTALFPRTPRMDSSYERARQTYDTRPSSGRHDPNPSTYDIPLRERKGETASARTFASDQKYTATTDNERRGKSRDMPVSQSNAQYADELNAPMIQQLLRNELLPLRVRIRSPDGDGRSGSAATIGGVLIIKDSLYALTVAHVFIESESDDERSRSIGSRDGSDYSQPVPRSAALELRNGSTASGGAINIRSRFDTRMQQRSPKLFNTNLDWALIPLVHSGAADLLEAFAPSTQSAREVFTGNSPLKTEVRICGARSGMHFGELQTSNSFMTFPWAQTSISVWTVNLMDGRDTRVSSLVKGDCGSWAVSLDGSILYGLVVAHVANRGNVMIIPAWKMLEDIRQTFNLGSRNLKTLLPGSGETIPGDVADFDSTSDLSEVDQVCRRSSMEFIDEQLDERHKFRPPRQAEQFFKVGRVLSVVIHSDYTADPRKFRASKEKWLTPRNNKSGYIFSHVQRYIVIKTGHGFCWALPINTYEGLATTKRGLTLDEIQAHAIVYSTDHKPSLVMGERTLSKRSIAIDCIDNHRLHYASRLNFAKVVTIEHNMWAMEIGMVAAESRADLMAYFKMERKKRYKEYNRRHFW